MCHVVGPLTLDVGCFQTIRHNLAIRALNTDNAITSCGIWFDIVIIRIQRPEDHLPALMHKLLNRIGSSCLAVNHVGMLGQNDGIVLRHLIRPIFNLNSSVGLPADAAFAA